MGTSDEELWTAYQGDLIGTEAKIVETRKLIERISGSRIRTVLIHGETGTGKGLVARLLHRRSERASGPFIDVNCAAIPANLIESELFGFEKGSFTGATGKKKGLIELAHEGTLFLDEIRELDLVSQAKLLGFLDTQEIRPIGSVRSRHVNIRLLTTTNVNLLGEVRAGRFREDLYYRLQMIAINIPPLRERGEDVLVLSEMFMRKFSNHYGHVISGLEPEVERLFLAYSWPGNVRELENLIERAFVLGEGDRIRASQLPARITRSVQSGERIVQESAPRGGQESSAARKQAIEFDKGFSFYDATSAFQRQLIESALGRAHGNLAVASRMLGLSRHALRHQLKKLFGPVEGDAALGDDFDEEDDERR